MPPSSAGPRHATFDDLAADAIAATTAVLADEMAAEPTGALVHRLVAGLPEWAASAGLDREAVTAACARVQHLPPAVQRAAALDLWARLLVLEANAGPLP